MCEGVRGRNVSRYEQFEISPEAIEQKLRPVVREQRKTDVFEKKNTVCYSDR